LRFKKITPLEF